MIWTIVGTIAMIAGLIAPIPQMMRSIQYKNAKGIATYFLILWLIDKAFSLLLMIHLHEPTMILKYSIGLIFIGVITYYKIFGNKDIN